jgi:hypothetical protein
MNTELSMEQLDNVIAGNDDYVIEVRNLVYLDDDDLSYLAETVPHIYEPTA